MKVDSAEYTLVVFNLATGFSVAIILARYIRKLDRKSSKIFSIYTLLIGVYFIECIAMSAGMGMPLFSWGLAFLWGIVFWIWLRDHVSEPEVLKTSFFLSLYSSMPAASLILIPVTAWAGGWQILSAQDGACFGIPESLHLPWPLNTLLGFYATLVIGTVVFKTVITTGGIGLLIRLGKRPGKAILKNQMPEDK